jgi:histidinol-phosphate aminotransferase
MYTVSAAIQGAAVVEAPLRADFSLDVDALLERVTRAARLVFVCTPNNPTGNLVPLDAIARLAAALIGRALLVVDEAYIEFAGVPSATTLLHRFDNLVVLRTLSKAHALAAARIGSLIAHADIVALLRRILPAYPLPSPCVDAALAGLTPAALAATRARVAALVEARDRLAAILRHAPGVIEVFPSIANFVLVRCSAANAVYRRLLAAGVVVRDVSRHSALGDCLRVSAGSDTDHAALEAALIPHEVAS